MTEKPPTPETINRLWRGVAPGAALLAGLQLDLFTALDPDGASPEAAARALGVDPDRLGRLMRALTLAGLLTRRDERFHNSAEAARYLSRRGKAYMGAVQGAWADLYQALGRTAETVRRGTAAAAKDFSNDPPEVLENFLGGLHPVALAAGRDLIRRLDLSGRRRLLDAGCGTAGVAIALCETLPDLTATAADLAPVAKLAQRFVAEAGLADRITAAPADLVADPPPGRYDLVVLRALLQVLGPDEAAAATRNLAAALDPGGLFVVISSSVLEEDRMAPPEAVFFDLVLANFFPGGRGYTLGEHAGWFADAGLAAPERLQLPNGSTLLWATRR
jgi:SAM-dependent methyltransferase